MGTVTVVSGVVNARLIAPFPVRAVVLRDVMEFATTSPLRPPQGVEREPMNKAITDGVVFMPPAFANGLDMWSRQDGTPGSDTYANAMNAAFVVADQDFAGCMELQKVDATQKLRYMAKRRCCRAVTCASPRG